MKTYFSKWRVVAITVLQSPVSEVCECTVRQSQKYFFFPFWI